MRGQQLLGAESSKMRLKSRWHWNQHTTWQSWDPSVNAADDRAGLRRLPSPASSQEGGELMVFRLAVELRADTKGRWSCPASVTREERVGRLSSVVRWRPVGGPGMRLIR